MQYYGRHEVQPRNASWQENFCFRCSKPGHIARYCLAPASVVQQPKSTLGTHVEEIEYTDESIQLAMEALSFEDD
jgi:hypothetical protein